MVEPAINIDNDTGGEGVSPSHVAIIMDGNGRWAKARSMPRLFGHRAGVDVLREIVEKSLEIGLDTLSVYAFSTENWRRPKEEVDGLFLLLKQFVKADLARLHSKNIRIRIQGSRDGIGKDVLMLIDEAQNLTAQNTGLNFVICFNYGGQSEIIEAVQKIAQDFKDNVIQYADINIENFSNYLNSADWSDPDLIIRTAGEKRLSNFLLWQSAYSELVFCDVLWPDFTTKDFENAISEFKQRKRRFGGI